MRKAKSQKIDKRLGPREKKPCTECKKPISRGYGSFLSGIYVCKKCLLKSKDLKGVPELSEGVLRELERHASLYSICGGTHSSDQLRHVLKLRETVTNEDIIKRLNRVIRVWRLALVRHNAQKFKVFEYDLETGEVKKEG